ncbi:carbonic anhydrase [Kushneria sinocarnis]|uniref:Carbonic anhydrase n=1 Tax=Kushneria sinocarnis TaxID=595502 RepID=A0A420X0G0_9GAMM|nr:carbonic anhydrase [Kushneria sinocarnis]RKR07264.1 carbonic anhydrase [Kushneria sinocarnis]
MEFHERVLLENRAWVEEMSRRDPEVFTRLNRGQAPEALWIGCSDSRVPAEQICNAGPGELFIHRNVANVVRSDEAGFMAVLQYAVAALQVKHIVVCGHHGCGGVKAAMADAASGLEHVDSHLAGVRDTCRSGQDELAAITDERQRVDRLVELNVIAQVRALGEMFVVREAACPPQLHGMVYALESGLLREIVRWERGAGAPLFPEAAEQPSAVATA